MCLVKDGPKPKDRQIMAYLQKVRPVTLASRDIVFEVRPFTVNLPEKEKKADVLPLQWAKIPHFRPSVERHFHKVK